MKRFLKAMTTAALLIGAAMFASAPAQADGVSITIGVPGIGFSYSSGGYCDDWGCPADYWDYPVYYGPVYYDGRWFRGPVYYRYINGRPWYWVHGGWHRDHWRGPYPRWYRRHHYRYGPALGYDYYRGHGFRHRHDRYWHGDNWRGYRRHHYGYYDRYMRDHRARDLKHDRRVIRHNRRQIRYDRQRVRHERRELRHARHKQNRDKRHLRHARRDRRHDRHNH